MAVNQKNFENIISELYPAGVVLVAVSKTKPVSDIRELYGMGQKDFGENYVQELVEKSSALPGDIRWHFIGHLQRNKVKYIAPFVHLIHGVDSEKLLKEIDKQAAANQRVINCLLQVHIAMEETKFGFDAAEITGLCAQIASGGRTFSHVRIRGLMGMASFTDDAERVKSEFQSLFQLYQLCRQQLPDFDVLSMGMSADYQLAIAAGSNMVRIGSLLFGER